MKNKRSQQKYRDSAPESLEKAVNLLGGQNATAAKLTAHLGRDGSTPVRQSHVWSWMYRSRLSPEMAIALEQLCAEAGHRVTRDELCPDFPWDAARKRATRIPASQTVQP